MSCFNPPKDSALRAAYERGYTDGKLDLALLMGKQRAQAREDAYRSSGGRLRNQAASGDADAYRCHGPTGDPQAATLAHF